jgi:hypothetical protein
MKSLYRGCRGSKRGTKLPVYVVQHGRPDLVKSMLSVYGSMDHCWLLWAPEWDLVYESYYISLRAGLQCRPTMLTVQALLGPWSTCVAWIGFSSQGKPQLSTTGIRAQTVYCGEPSANLSCRFLLAEVSSVAAVMAR